MSDQTNGDLPFKYGQPMEDGFVPDKTMTEIVHAVVKNFDDELRNTPDYTKRRNWHLGKVGEIIGAKIASGELMVVKTVSPSRNDMGTWECPYCYQTWFEHDSPDPGEFCKCGAKIIEG